jgi:glutathione S-transferase
MAERGKAKLYVIPASHPCRAAMLMLEHKRVPYQRVVLETTLHPFTVRARGFPGRTVPALRIDGRRVQTNRNIARFLDQLQPDPPLFPAQPDARELVEEAERWGDEVLQPTARRIALGAVIRDGLDGLEDRGDGGSLGYVLYKRAWVRERMMPLIGRHFRVTEEKQREDLAALPGLLDRVDGWLEAGVLGGDQLNAADFQIAPSISLLLYVCDLRPQIEARPAAAFAQRLIP